MRQANVARNAMWALAALLWCGVARLAFAFFTNELQWRYVAEQSRRDAPWYYRIAGVWGGSEGSLLLFSAIVAVFGSVAVRRVERPAVGWLATATCGAVAAVNLVFANPFRQLAAPAVRGFGLTPILEHPAMAVHPPLLYAGFGCAFAAALVVLDRRDATAWLRRTLAVVILAMALGALWSYVEQGWGGYWAWDPVENTSLLVWLGALVALHVPQRVVLGVLPWLAVLAGAPLVRSGAVPSVHSFAEQASVGWALLAVSIIVGATIVALLLTFARSGAHSAPERANAAVVIGSVVLAIVAVGTFAPPLIDIVQSRPAAVRGVFYSRTVGPLALIAVPFLVLRLRVPTSRLVHVGALVLLLGIGASTFDRAATATLAAGDSAQVAGLSVASAGVAIEPGPRADVDQVVANLTINGWTMRPALVAYPERGGVLAETAMVSRPWRDVQVTLLDANDLGTIRIEVRQRPLMWLVWLGAALVTLGALTPTWRWSRHRDVPASGQATR